MCRMSLHLFIGCSNSFKMLTVSIRDACLSVFLHVVWGLIDHSPIIQEHIVCPQVNIYQLQIAASLSLAIGPNSHEAEIQLIGQRG